MFLQPRKAIQIGLDIGYGWLKALIEGMEPVLFQTVCGHAREIKFRKDDITSKYPGEQITDDDGTWFVGGLALSQIPQGELLRLRGRTANGDAMGMAFRQRMMKVALGKLFAGAQGEMHGNQVYQVQIATGLPVDHMPKADLLKEALIGKHHIKTDWTEFVADVVEVNVMPQPYGIIYSQMMCPGGTLNMNYTAVRTGVLLPGTYTIEALTDDNGEYIEAGSGSVESGLFTAHERIASLLEERYGEKPSYAAVEKVLLTGKFKAYGETEDLSAEVKSALEPLHSASLNLCTDKFRSGASIDTLLVAGGPSPLIWDEVKHTYRQAVQVEKPQIAVARGFLNYVQFEANQPGRL
jgi:hypothetical protein